MFGWCKEAMTCASRWKREVKLASACSLVCNNLIATKRCNCVSNAFQTSAIPPLPRRSRNSYFPSLLDDSVLIAYPSLPECVLDQGGAGIARLAGPHIEGRQSLRGVVDLRYSIRYLAQRVYLAHECIVRQRRHLIQQIQAPD